MARNKRRPPSRSPTSPRARGRGAPELPGTAGAGEVRAALRRLPTLACEPELARAGFDPRELDQARRIGEAAPDTIERLAGSAFHAKLLVALNDLRNRSWKSADELTRFLVDSASYYIEQVRGPAWDNPLVVALYCRDAARLEGRDLPAEECLAACERYEHDYQTLLEAKVAARGKT